MSLATLQIALQGLFPLSPIAVAVQGLLGADATPPLPPDPPPPVVQWVTLAPRRSSSRKRVGLWVEGRPVWVEQQPTVKAAPVARQPRPRRKRDAEAMLFL